MQAPVLVLMLYDAVLVAVFIRWHFPNECGRQAGKGVPLGNEGRRCICYSNEGRQQA